MQAGQFMVFSTDRSCAFVGDTTLRSRLPATRADVVVPDASRAVSRDEENTRRVRPTVRTSTIRSANVIAAIVGTGTVYE